MRGEVAAELSVARREEAAVVTVVGSLDADNVAELERALAHAFAPPGPSRTVLDLSALDFADSSVLHVLLESQRQHRSTGRRLVVCGPYRPVVHRLFDVTGTAEFFELTEDLATALAPVR
ncbi:STAS domain-containing protein [Streptomyces sp. NPDC087300]|uniref:STAS domain-containing protein n=1 Tax=Streptomyces sp. NPDC087300 TaxID=3365780 RepID=UPI00380915A5